MNQTIIISADSTCDLGKTLQQRYRVHFLPYHIVLGDKDYLDNVDITPDEIFALYQKEKILPKTAAISVGECADYFRQWTEQGYEVIHINLGSGLSSTHQNCRIAAGMLEGVYVIDSCNLSSGTGHLVIEAAKRAAAGMAAPEIVKELETLKTKVHSSFILDTLAYMAAGGRCSTLTALGANILNLKPCIEVENDSGKMHVGKKYRGNLKDVLKRYVGDKLKAYPDIRQDKIFITTPSIDERYVQMVRETILEVMPFDEIFFTTASCTIASHCGPNTLGILFMTR